MKAKKIVAAFMATTLLLAAAGCSTGKRVHGTYPDDDDRDSDTGFDVDYDNNIDDGRIRSGLAVDWMNGEPWFIKKNGIEISDPGPFNFPMGDIASDNIKKYPAFVTLEENHDDCKDGYKNVVATCSFRRDAGTEGMWISAFDKYTGYTFECSDHSFELYEGCNDLNYSAKDFKVGDHDVHVEWTFISEQKDQITTFTLIVKCPEEYNGCVFQFGPENHDSKIDYCDLDHQLYDINEIGYGSNKYYVYFAIEARQVN